MKTMAGTLFKRLGLDLNSVLLACYLLAVLSAHYFVSMQGTAGGFLFWITAVTAGVLLAVCPYLLRRLSRVEIMCRKEEEKKNGAVWFALFFLLSFLVLCCYYTAYFPGGFSSDSIYQYSQAQTGVYNDWHPVLHTFVVFAIPLKLTGYPAAIIFFQIVWCSLILAYMAETFRMYGNMTYAAGSLLFILMNPVTGSIMMYPWKDVGFAASALLSMVYVLRTNLSKGAWLEKRGHAVMFSAVLVFAALARHNGILFALPLLAAIFFYSRKKRWVQAVFLFFALWFAVKVPFYSMLHVEAPDGRKMEVLGLPLTVIGNVAKENPGAMDSQTAEFVYDLAPKESWEYYQCGSFNHIKFHGVDWDAVEERSVPDILGMMLRCIKNAPGHAFMALFSLTDLVYAVDGDTSAAAVLSAGITENESGIEYAGNEKLRNYLGSYSSIINKGIFKYVFQYIGIMNLAVLCSILAKNNFKRADGWKRSFFAVPLLAYNFGTMLLLTGADFRFFYVSFLVCPVIIFAMFHVDFQVKGSQLLLKKE